MINALTFNLPHKNCKSATVVVKTKLEFQKFSDSKNIVFYQLIDNDFDGEFFLNNIYLKSLFLKDNIIDAVIGKVLKGNFLIIIDACRNLKEVGACDVKYGGSPIMYANKLGLLQNAMIAGAVYLDKDDLDLIIQSNAKLILTPSFDAQKGNGIAPLKMIKSKNALYELGTMDNSTNITGDIGFEKQILKLLVNGSMCEKVL